tara:strand:- start:1420 stop:1542 length:123 start_codon:yes stop_codon:yes gene_type:complete
MENILTILLMGVTFGMGIIAGMYIVTQISNWIDKQIKNKK